VIVNNKQNENMNTPKQILENLQSKYASLLKESTPMCEYSDSLLDTLATEAGYASASQIGNEHGSWSAPVSSVAKDLVECAAQLEAEKAGLGRWESLDEFLAEAK
jgi:hypothetical protein